MAAEKISLVPRAAMLLESMRDIGYTFETAVADLIDNSISANAKHVWIDALWNKGDKFVAISDDGKAMDREALIEAMRLGSADPTATRDASDLGRFGLGLKTASLSQCRRFTVVCKCQSETYAATWDIDEAKMRTPPHDWDVSIVKASDLPQNSRLAQLIAKRLTDQTGSLVFWEHIDRPDPDSTSKTGGENFFNAQIASVIEHLALTFHRFLNGEPKLPKINLFVNSRPVEGFDPYNSNQIATKQPAPEVLKIRHENVRITPYVLPHPSKVSAEEYRKYEGKDGYLENAGFYIYRNGRLISKGTWYRLIRRSNLSKLLRIQVDVPSSLDYLWSIDVRKSQSEVPADIKKELSNFIQRWENEAKVVFHHRGTKLIETTVDPMWNRVVNEGSIHYQVNRDHPFLNSLRYSLSAEQAKALSQYLDLVDATFPHAALMCDLDNDKKSVTSARLPEDAVLDMLRQYVKLSQRTWTEDELLRTGAFRDYPEVIHKFAENGFL